MTTDYKKFKKLKSSHEVIEMKYQKLKESNKRKEEKTKKL